MATERRQNRAQLVRGRTVAGTPIEILRPGVRGFLESLLALQ
ncbi:MAG TPA: hypothetical protein VJ226_11270 [Bradyrhizobium sp.]|nr:hypothetical protein [Bradyrhizobium sp.]